MQMRPTCLDCVRKHLAQASILHTEMVTGYPHFKWYVIGQLAEAEAECVTDYPEFANTIREYRKEFEADESCKLPYEQLIIDATELDDAVEEVVEPPTVRITGYMDNVDDYIHELDDADEAEAVKLAAASRAREEAKD